MIHRIQIACSVAVAMAASISFSVASATQPPELAKELEKFQDWKFGLMMHWGIQPVGLHRVVAAGRGGPLGPARRPQAVDRAEQGFRTVFSRLPRAEHDLQPAAVRSTAMGGGRQERRHEVRRLHHQAPRRLLHVRHQADGLPHDPPSCPFHADPQADVVKAVFDAFRKQGFGIGAYYSKSDWHHPGYWSPDWPHPNRNVNYDTGSIRRNGRRSSISRMRSSGS